MESFFREYKIFWSIWKAIHDYRVDDLTALGEQLRAEGVTIVDDIETVEYGKFVHILDIEGNKNRAIGTYGWIKY